MASHGSATLQRWQDKGLVFERAVRHDWRLLEADENILQELFYNT